MSFPDFLKVMHEHSRVEKLPNEITDAFRAGDPKKRGIIPASQLRHMLLHWGEHLSTKEGKRNRVKPQDLFSMIFKYSISVGAYNSF